MPIAADHLKGSSAARHLFAGRRQELAQFETLLWTRQPRDQYKVVSIAGLGGQGKTTLLERMRARLVEADAKEIPRAFLDFELSRHRDPVLGVLEARNQLRRSGVATNAFDIAFKRHFNLTRAGRDIRNDFPELFELEGGFAGDLVDIALSAAENVPGGKLAFGLLTRGGTAFLNWYRNRGSALVASLASLGAQDLQRELPICLGQDLCAALEGKAGPRPIVFVDTYEAAWRSENSYSGIGSSGADAWLRSLAENAPGTLFVIVGRRFVDWGDVDEDWNAVITRITLGELDDVGQEALLKAVGVTDEAVAGRIKETAKGHPLTLKTQLRIFEKIAAAGRVPQPEDFPTTHKAVLDRFLDHVDDATRGIVRALAVPSFIEEPMWSQFGREGFACFDSHAPEEILEEVFFRASGGGTFLMHENVRDHMIAELSRHDSGFLARARLAMFDYFDRASSMGAQRRAPHGIPDHSVRVQDRDIALNEAADLLAAAAPARLTPWLISRFSGDLGLTPSRTRIPLFEKACLVLPNEPLDRLRLARLVAEVDPFSSLVKGILEDTLPSLSASDSEIRSEVIQIASHFLLTPADRISAPLGNCLKTFLIDDAKLSIRLAIAQRRHTEAYDLARRLIRDLRKNPPRELEPSATSVIWDAVLVASAVNSSELLSDVCGLIRAEDGDVRSAHVCVLIAALCYTDKLEWTEQALCNIYDMGSASDVLHGLVRSMPCAFDVDLLSYAVGAVLTNGGRFKCPDGLTFPENAHASLAGRSVAETVAAIAERLGDIGKDNGFPRFGWGSPRWKVVSDVLNPNDPVYIEFAINSRGESILFANAPVFLTRSNDCLLLNPDYSRLTVTQPDCSVPGSLHSAYDFSMPIRPEIGEYLGAGGRVLVVLMDVYTGQPVVGDFMTAYVVSEETMRALRESGPHPAHS
jgi:hypothetical protein